MKKDDFERLKAVCEKEGFEIIQDALVEIDGTIAFVRKKDPWEGVEFVTLVKCANGFVYKVIEQKDNEICIIANGNQWFNKCMFEPSTEQAYTDQLKKEAFERFGEIREGDRFDRTTIDEKWGSNTIMDKSPFGNFHWKYDRSSDTLFIGRFGIYSKGKWAERVKERVKVVKFSNMGDINDNSMRFTFEISGKKIEQFYLYGVSEFIASQLEKYLNGEIE